MKHLKHHPINNKSQKLSRLKKEDHTKAREKKIEAEKYLAETPKKRGGTSKPTNKKLDGEKFLSESFGTKNMKHLKKFENFTNESIEVKLKDILSKIGVKNWKVGEDHLGNNDVIIFNHNGFDFEIYSIDGIEVDSNKGEAFHVNYGKNGKWIDNFNTMNLEKSLSEICDKIDSGIGDKYVG